MKFNITRKFYIHRKNAARFAWQRRLARGRYASPYPTDRTNINQTTNRQNMTKIFAQQNSIS